MRSKEAAIEQIQIIDAPASIQENTEVSFVMIQVLFFLKEPKDLPEQEPIPVEGSYR